MNKIAKLILAANNDSSAEDINDEFNNALSSAEQERQRVDRGYSYHTPDNRTHPKTNSGSSRFPGQNDGTILRLMELEPYMTYDNVLAALARRSRLNNEKSKADLRAWVFDTYNNMNDANADLSQDYTLEDEANINRAINIVKRNIDKEYNAELDNMTADVNVLEKKLKELNIDIATVQRRVQKLKDQRLRIASDPRNYESVNGQRSKMDQLEFELARLENKLSHNINIRPVPLVVQRDKLMIQYEDKKAELERYRKDHSTFNKQYNSHWGTQEEINQNEAKIKEQSEKLRDDSISQDEKLKIQESIDSLEEKNVALHNDYDEKYNSNIQNLANVLIDENLYAQYSPYAAARDFLIKNCGGIDSRSDRIVVTNADTPTYEYNKSPEFQQALSVLANQSPNIYDEIIQDIYMEYKSHPNFTPLLTDDKVFSAPTSRRYEDLKVQEFQEVAPGQGDYSYDEELRQYVPDKENGNFKLVDKIVPQYGKAPLHHQTVYNKTERTVQTRPYTDEQIKQWADQFIRTEYRDQQKFINPILIAWQRHKKRFINILDRIKSEMNGKYSSPFDSYRVEITNKLNLFKHDVKKIADILQKLDNIDTTKSIASKNYEATLERMLQAIRYIDEDAVTDFTKLKANSIEDIAQFNFKYVSSIIEELISRINRLAMVKDDATLAKVKATIDALNNSDKQRVIDNAGFKNDVLKALDTYNHSIYKDKNAKINPILIAWVYHYHDWEDLRIEGKKTLENNVKGFQALMNRKVGNQTLTERANDLRKSIDSTLKKFINENSPSTWTDQQLKNFLSEKALIEDFTGMDSKAKAQKVRIILMSEKRDELRKDFNDLYQPIIEYVADVYNSRKAMIPTMNQLLHGFIDQTKTYGEQLVNVVEQNGLAARWIAPRSKWMSDLKRIAEYMDDFVAGLESGRLKNFNIVQFVDLFENAINALAGGTKPYNNVAKSEMKQMESLNLSWALADLNSTLNEAISQANASMQTDINNMQNGSQTTSNNGANKENNTTNTGQMATATVKKKRLLSKLNIRGDQH